MPDFLNSTLVFAGRLLDRKELEKSSSGGAFTALTNWAFENGCAVVCSHYDYARHQQTFSFVDNIEQRNRARGSKYVQANPDIPYHEIEKWVKNNEEKKLLFIGLGCQAAAVARYAELKKFRERIFAIDIVCHGVASPQIWKEYIQIEEDKRGKIYQLSFKDKRNGWEHPIACAKTEKGEFDLTKYVNMFYSGDILRPACTECPYATTKRASDMTIGDFWGIQNQHPEFYDSMGTSLFLIHTHAGKFLFDEIRDQMEWRESTLQNCQQTNLQYPTKMNPDRKSYWNDYFKYGIKYVTQKYGNPNLLQRFIRKIKKCQTTYKAIGEKHDSQKNTLLLVWKG